MEQHLQIPLAKPLLKVEHLSQFHQANPQNIMRNILPKYFLNVVLDGFDVEVVVDVGGLGRGFVL